MNKQPLLQDWAGPYDMPAFSDIETNQYEAAFSVAIDEHRGEIDKIATNPEAATFENTITAMERSGKTLGRISAIFFNLTSANTNDELQKIQRQISPVLARHYSEIYLNQDLFARVNSLYENIDNLGLTDEQKRVLEEYAKGFFRSGAQLNETERNRMSEISQRLAELGTGFSQNVLKDEAGYQLVLEDDDLEGLPAFLVKSAEVTAKELGMDGKKVITLSRSSIEPFLQFSARRDLREKAFKAWINRGANGGDTDNLNLISETVKLRNEKARLLGFKNFAEYKLDNSMAKSTEAANNLLVEVWGHAQKRVEQERLELQAEMSAEGLNEDLQPWDWRYYSEKVRKDKYDLDDGAVEPYFQLENMIQAAFETANRLFGLSFKERKDCDVYHPDVRVWDVTDQNDNFVGRFLGDYFARPSKQGGAWMNSFRSQHRLDNETYPIIVNVLNFVKAPEGQQALLTFDDATTLFHEFGHALHGMLSNVTYPSLSGTNVVRDFVELPSQLYEHWMYEPEILKKYAVHVETGETIPDDLLEKILKAKNFNQGFLTTEYLSCAILDLQLHSMELSGELNPEEFEKEALEKLGMPSEIVMRHRLPHFLHLFSGEGYASGYYSYMWSEVMDCDAYNAFEEAGNSFDPDVANRLREYIYSSGGRYDPQKAYELFRGRMPETEALLKKRELIQ